MTGVVTRGRIWFLALAVLCCGCTTDDNRPTSTDVTSTSTTTTAAPATTAASAASGTALALLADLPVKGRAPKTGYTRAQFGPAWPDVDHNGCDTRNDILNRNADVRRPPGRHP